MMEMNVKNAAVALINDSQTIEKAKHAGSSYLFQQRAYGGDRF